LAGRHPTRATGGEPASLQFRLAVYTPYRRARQKLIQETARKLAISPYTFQRKLQEEGASFQAALDNVRKSLAQQYIQSGAYDLQRALESAWPLCQPETRVERLVSFPPICCPG